MLSHDKHDVQGCGVHSPIHHNSVETGDAGFNNTIHLVELQ